MSRTREFIFEDSLPTKRRRESEHVSRFPEAVLPLIMSFLPTEDTNRCMIVDRIFYRAIHNNWTMMHRTKMEISIQFIGKRINVAFSKKRNGIKGRPQVNICVTKTTIECCNRTFPKFLIPIIKNGASVEVLTGLNAFCTRIITISSQMDTLSLLMKSLFQRAHICIIAMAGDDYHLEFMLDFIRNHYNGPIDDVSLHFNMLRNEKFSHLYVDFAKHFKLEVFAVREEHYSELPSLLDLPSEQMKVNLHSFTWSLYRIYEFIEDWKSTSRKLGIINGFDRICFTMPIWSLMCRRLGVQSVRKTNDNPADGGEYFYFDLHRDTDNSVLRIKYYYNVDKIQLVDPAWEY